MLPPIESNVTTTPLSRFAKSVVSALTVSLSKRNSSVKFASSYQPAKINPSFVGSLGSATFPSVEIYKGTSLPPLELNVTLKPLFPQPVIAKTLKPARNNPAKRHFFLIFQPPKIRQGYVLILR